MKDNVGKTSVELVHGGKLPSCLLAEIYSEDALEDDWEVVYVSEDLRHMMGQSIRMWRL